MYGLLLISLWACFIFIISFTEEVDTKNFFYFCSFIFYLTYYINTLNNINMSLRTVLLLLLIPSFIMWYAFITDNYFLKVEPISYWKVTFSMFLYFYIFIYLLSEYLTKNR